MQCLSGMALIAAAAGAFADDGFTITRFEVEGNSLLPADEVQRLLQPMSGSHRVYGDIQQALEALETAYRKASPATSTSAKRMSSPGCRHSRAASRRTRAQSPRQCN